MIDLDLTGRKAIVTGASLGIGAATVRLLADHGATRRVLRPRPRRRRRPGGLTQRHDIRGYVADMSDADSTNRRSGNGQPHDIGDADILVNNVGASPSRNFLYMDDADWEQLFQLNMMSAVRCTRHVLPRMRAQQWGRVVMISTVGALYPSAASHRLRSDQVGDDLHRQGARRASTAEMACSSTQSCQASSTPPCGIGPPAELADSTGKSQQEIMANNSKGVPGGPVWHPRRGRQRRRLPVAPTLPPTSTARPSALTAGPRVTSRPTRSRDVALDRWLGGGDTVMFGLALGHIVGLAEHAWCRRGPCPPTHGDRRAVQRQRRRRLELMSSHKLSFAVMRPNPVKDRLAAGETLYGTMVFEFLSAGLPQISAGRGRRLRLLRHGAQRLLL